MKKTIKSIYHHLASDSLYRNSIYLMASTAVMAFFGFFFWILNARLFTVEQVGLATTIISIVGLFTNLSNLGMNAGLIRFLPTSQAKNEKINSAFTINIFVSLIVVIVFLLGLKFFSPKLLFLRENIVYLGAFILFVVFSNLNPLIESVFISFRSSGYILVKNIVMSVGKLLFPILLVSLGTFGIFSSLGVATVVSILVSIIILTNKFNYNFRLNVNIDIVKNLASFSFGNYIAGFISMFPAMILPVIVTNKLGAEESAYFYIAMMIANLIYIIPQATTQSLFAEGSYTKSSLNTNIVKSTKVVFALIVPTLILTYLFGNTILLVFGKSYSTEAYALLIVLAIASIFISINYILGTLLKLNDRILSMIIGNLIGTITILLLSILFIESGLFAIGVAWLVGSICNMIAYLFFYLKSK